MCIGTPSLVIETNGKIAVVEAAGEKLTVSLILMNVPVKVGDYLLVQVGNFAVEVIEPERAKDALAYMEALLLEINNG